MQRKLVRLAIVTGILLLVPLVAMQFTNEVVWTLSDFVVAGSMLFGAGLAYELLAAKGSNIAFRAAVALAIGTALFLVWANLAVGLIGSEQDPANLMYVGVLTIGAIGTFLARSRPEGMARALFATALAQISVAMIALAAGMHQEPGSSISQILNVNGFFVVLWLGSALLFRRAGGNSNRVRQASLPNQL